MTLGKKIKLLRTQKGWSQAQLAEKIGATKQRVSKYEHDIHVPIFEVLKKMSTIFDVSLDYLIFDKDIHIKNNFSFNDEELFQYFKIADNLSSKQRKIIKEIIDEFFNR